VDKVSAEAERFWSKVDKSGECWTWLGARNDVGYGRHSFRGRRVMAHRVAYMLTAGDIADGLQLDHLCRNRLCVNPGHLEAVSQYENIMRSEAWSALNNRKTHCVNGHEFTSENTYVRLDRPGRQCRTCVRERQARAAASRVA
jgi:hypothetical protein